MSPTVALNVEFSPTLISELFKLLMSELNVPLPVRSPLHAVNLCVRRVVINAFKRLGRGGGRCGSDIGVGRGERVNRRAVAVERAEAAEFR